MNSLHQSLCLADREGSQMLPFVFCIELMWPSNWTLRDSGLNALASYVILLVLTTCLMSIKYEWEKIKHI